MPSTSDTLTRALSGFAVSESWTQQVQALQHLQSAFVKYGKELSRTSSVLDQLRKEVAQSRRQDARLSVLITRERLLSKGNTALRVRVLNALTRARSVSPLYYSVVCEAFLGDAEALEALEEFTNHPEDGDAHSVAVEVLALVADVAEHSQAVARLVADVADLALSVAFIVPVARDTSPPPRHLFVGSLELHGPPSALTGAVQPVQLLRRSLPRQARRTVRITI